MCLFICYFIFPPHLLSFNHFLLSIQNLKNYFKTIKAFKSIFQLFIIIILFIIIEFINLNFIFSFIVKLSIIFISNLIIINTKLFINFHHSNFS